MVSLARLTTDRNNAEAYYRLAMHLKKKSGLIAARENLKPAISRDPTYFIAYMELADIQEHLWTADVYGMAALLVGVLYVIPPFSFSGALAVRSSFFPHYHW